MTEDHKPQPIEIQLAVLDSKMDGIQNTLNVRLQSMDDRIAKNGTDIENAKNHATNGLNAQADAFKAQLATKTDKVQSEERYVAVVERIHKMEGSQTWIGRIVVGAVIIAVLGGGYIANQVSHVARPAASASQ